MSAVLFRSRHNRECLPCLMHQRCGNVILIVAQNPEASQVACYRQWQQMGRQVKRGEQGLKILVPHRQKIVEDSNEDAEERENNYGAPALTARRSNCPRNRGQKGLMEWTLQDQLIMDVAVSERHSLAAYFHKSGSSIEFQGWRLLYIHHQSGTLRLWKVSQALDDGVHQQLADAQPPKFRPDEYGHYRRHLRAAFEVGADHPDRVSPSLLGKQRHGPALLGLPQTPNPVIIWE